MANTPLSLEVFLEQVGPQSILSYCVEFGNLVMTKW